MARTLKALLCVMTIPLLLTVGCDELTAEDADDNNINSPAPGGAQANPQVPQQNTLAGTINGIGWKLVSGGVDFWDYGDDPTMEIILIGTEAQNPCGNEKRKWFDAGYVKIRLPKGTGNFASDAEEDKDDVWGSVKYYDPEEDTHESDYIGSYSAIARVSIAAIDGKIVSGSLTLTSEYDDHELAGDFIVEECEYNYTYDDPASGD